MFCPICYFNSQYHIATMELVEHNPFIGPGELTLVNSQNALIPSNFALEPYLNTMSKVKIDNQPPVIPWTSMN